MGVDTINQQPHLQDVACILQQTTEAAATAAWPLLGSGGDGKDIDNAAKLAMERVLGSNSTFRGRVVIGEGVKDEAPHLPHGASFGSGDTEWGIAVDPIEGTRFAAGLEGPVLSVIAATRFSSESIGSFPRWNGMKRMASVVVGPGNAAALLHENPHLLDNNPERLYCEIAEALGKSTCDLTIAMLDRPTRNGAFARAAENLGANLIKLEHGDLAPAISACMGFGVDIRIGSGGSPEAVLAAAVARAKGGAMLAKWCITDEKLTDGQYELLGRERFTEVDLTGQNEVAVVLTAVRDHEMLKLGGCHTDVNNVVQPGKSLVITSGAQK